MLYIFIIFVLIFLVFFLNFFGFGVRKDGVCVLSYCCLFFFNDIYILNMESIIVVVLDMI